MACNTSSLTVRTTRMTRHHWKTSLHIVWLPLWMLECTRTMSCLDESASFIAEAPGVSAPFGGREEATARHSVVGEDCWSRLHLTCANTAGEPADGKPGNCVFIGTLLHIGPLWHDSRWFEHLLLYFELRLVFYGSPGSGFADASRAGVTCDDEDVVRQVFLWWLLSM